MRRRPPAPSHFLYGDFLNNLITFASIAAAVFFFVVPDDVPHPYDGDRRPRSVGLPLPGSICDSDGQDGEILLRGPKVFGGYWERPQAATESFNNGWFRTGDLGRLDPTATCGSWDAPRS